MILKSLKSLIFLWTGVLIYFCSAVYADDPSIGEIRLLIQEERRELSQLKAKIERQNQKISSFGIRQTSLLQELSRIERQVKRKEKELKIHGLNIKINKREITKLSHNIRYTEKSIKKIKEELMRWLRVIYKEGGVFPVRLLFSADGVTDLLQRVKFMGLVTEYD